MSDHLIVFVKNPIAGAAKTRLQTRYTPQQAARISRAFILDTLTYARAVPADRHIILYTPSDAKADIGRLAGAGWRLRLQADADLGGRMRDAAACSFGDGATRVVLIGSDIPSLPSEHIVRAFDLLHRKDVALGPSTDGGYYLLGLSRPVCSLFQDVAWSTPHVLPQTLDRLESSGLSLGLLPPWYDVDTPEDLNFLRVHIQALKRAGHPFPCHTERCLAALT